MFSDCNIQWKIEYKVKNCTGNGLTESTKIPTQLSSTVIWITHFVNGWSRLALQANKIKKNLQSTELQHNCIWTEEGLPHSGQTSGSQNLSPTFADNLIQNFFLRLIFSVFSFFLNIPIFLYSFSISLHFSIFFFHLLLFFSFLLPFLFFIFFSCLLPSDLSPFYCRIILHRSSANKNASYNNCHW